MGRRSPQNSHMYSKTVSNPGGWPGRVFRNEALLKSGRELRRCPGAHQAETSRSVVERSTKDAFRISTCLVFYHMRRNESPERALLKATRARSHFLWHLQPSAARTCPRPSDPVLLALSQRISRINPVKFRAGKRQAEPYRLSSSVQTESCLLSLHSIPKLSRFDQTPKDQRIFDTFCV